MLGGRGAVAFNSGYFSCVRCCMQSVSQGYMTNGGSVLSAPLDSGWAVFCFVFYSAMDWIQDLVYPPALTLTSALFLLFTLRQDPTKLILINID